ncbi:gamma-glutamylputrescine synthetase PuuA [Anaplasma platys]|uniref:Gamma-glutamylputrescine synthetase PuuA n=1 Tax=Anaplasma platys TaxID=949 RepID=A0A858PYY9_9RICK|nr:glutamine synthetase [Anaplasma platys]QJC27815.1 gamma-glutamylputrescine synthetase PuuA [Anaplasma platys]
MLDKIITYLYGKLGIHPIIGVELEFYLRGKSSDFDLLLKQLAQQLGALRFTINSEYGEHQYELQTYHTEKITQLLVNLEAAKKLMQKTARLFNCAVDFSAKPYKTSAGSAFHAHVNLADKDMQNLFSRDSEGNVCPTLLHCIGGLCAFMKKHMLYFAPREESYLRYAIPDIHTPSTVSWGSNNRSAALRLPDTTLAPEKCRIEHRVSGADCNPKAAISAILFGILRGLEQRISPPEKVFGIASDPQYHLEKLPLSLEEARELAAPLRLSF